MGYTMAKKRGGGAGGATGSVKGSGDGAGSIKKPETYDETQAAS